MITHNDTYLLHATHHGMPIAAATMGGKMVFGSKWLLPLTQQAIVAAFGSEGGEVIRKTNDYLNRIATTDPARALLLAGFINEDPMLVCSLVETSKTRILDTNGAINTPLGVNSSSKTVLKITMEFTVYSGGVIIGQQANGDSQDWRLFCTGGTMYFDCGSARINQGWALNRKAEIECGDTYIIADGVKKTANASGTIANAEIVLCDKTGAFKSYGNMEIYDGEQWNVFAPMIDQDGVGCLLNTTKGTKHYPTAGTFTIELTPHNPRLMRGRDNT